LCALGTKRDKKVKVFFLNEYNWSFF